MLEHMENTDQQAAPGIAPEAPAPQRDTSAEVKQVVLEDLSIATQAGLEAVELADPDQTIPEETKQKIGQATLLMSEAMEELSAEAMPSGGEAGTAY